MDIDIWTTQAVGEKEINYHIEREKDRNKHIQRERWTPQTWERVKSQQLEPVLSFVVNLSKLRALITSGGAEFSKIYHKDQLL